MKKFISQIVAGVLGLWLVVLFVPEIKIEIFPDSSFFGIPLTQNWHLIVLLGVILGLLNFFLKPILNLITVPLRFITLGLSSLIIDMALIWLIDLVFQEITIPLFLPLLWTTLAVWSLNFILPNLIKRNLN